MSVDQHRYKFHALTKHEKFSDDHVDGKNLSKFLK